MHWCHPSLVRNLKIIFFYDVCHSLTLFFYFLKGRADYCHHLADLFGGYDCSSVMGKAKLVPEGSTIRGLDVGTGSGCIYPLLGAKFYGWSFVGSDIRQEAVITSEQIILANDLTEQIEVRLQLHSERIFDGVWGRDELFDFTMCNPPFYSSREAFLSESLRKVRGLARSRDKRQIGKGKKQIKLHSSLSKSGCSVVENSKNEKRNQEGGGLSNNFGGSDSELWCPGGEVAFVSRMVEESAKFADRCLWFTSLVSRQDNVDKIEKKMKKNNFNIDNSNSKRRRRNDNDESKGVGTIKIIKKVRIGAGTKYSTILMWSYFSLEMHTEWAMRRGWG